MPTVDPVDLRWRWRRRWYGSVGSWLRLLGGGGGSRSSSSSSDGGNDFLLRVFVVVTFETAIVVVFVLVVLAVRLAEVVLLVVVDALDGLGHEIRASIPIGLHRAAQFLELVVFALQLVDEFLRVRALFGHLKNVLVGRFLLARELHVLLFEPLGLFRHFFHFLAERQEQIIAVVECVFDLLCVSEWGDYDASKRQRMEMVIDVS